MKHEHAWSLRTSQALNGPEKKKSKEKPQKERGMEISDLIRGSQDGYEGTLQMHELLCKETHTHWSLAGPDCEYSHS